MKYVSTNHKAEPVSLEQAVLTGVPADGGLFMPAEIRRIPPAFFKNIAEMTLTDIAYVVVNTLFGEDIESSHLNSVVKETLSFDIPLKQVDDGCYGLELFHGPTMSSKDLGSRFMARVLKYFNRKVNGVEAKVNVLVATNGDAGAAVANGFHAVPEATVWALYPRERLSPVQEAQIATLGGNIRALEVRGTFDDCQNLALTAFMDPELREHMIMTSANSINIASLLPQTLFFFSAYAQLARMGQDADAAAYAIPAGNLGHVTAALIARRMGLKMGKIIVADNHNDVFCRYLETGEYAPIHVTDSIAAALDVGDPSNFVRVMDMYGGDHAALCADVTAVRYGDDEIAATLRDAAARGAECIYDPNGAVALRALKECADGRPGVFLAPAHPAK
ncbi:MAG: threonine synthase, partial [Muribaculaceae bacterium]|nr:threonine synthase [Muribaculaceae bacterium]